MSDTQILFLGFIAGATIFLGLPLGRLKSPKPELRQLLNSFSIGILLFLFWDVIGAAWEPVDAALAEIHESHASIAPAIGWGALFVVGLTVGLLSLVYYEKWLVR